MDLNHFDMTNPFSLIQKEDDVPVFVATMVGNFIKEAPVSKPENAECVSALLQSLVYFLYKEVGSDERNFMNLVKLLKAAEIRKNDTEFMSPLDVIFADFEKKYPGHIAAKQYSIFKKTKPQTAADVLGDLQIEMATLLSGCPYYRKHRREICNKLRNDTRPSYTWSPQNLTLI